MTSPLHSLHRLGSDPLSAALDAALQPVGFLRQAPEWLSEASDSLKSAQMLFSDYAMILVVETTAEDLAILSEAALRHCEQLMAKARKRDFQWDAYLLLALPNNPLEDAATKARIDAFEQGRTVARRHVIWPTSLVDSPASWKQQLERITCAALPPTSAPRQGIQHTDNDPFTPEWLLRIEDLLAAGGSYTDAAILFNKATLNPTTEGQP